MQLVEGLIPYVFEQHATAALDASLLWKDVDRHVQLDRFRLRKCFVLLVALFVVRLQLFEILLGFIAVQHVGVVEDPPTKRHGRSEAQRRNPHHRARQPLPRNREALAQPVDMATSEEQVRNNPHQHGHQRPVRTERQRRGHEVSPTVQIRVTRRLQPDLIQAVFEAQAVEHWQPEEHHQYHRHSRKFRTHEHLNQHRHDAEQIHGPAKHQEQPDEVHAGLEIVVAVHGLNHHRGDHDHRQQRHDHEPERHDLAHHQHRIRHGRRIDNARHPRLLFPVHQFARVVDDDDDRNEQITPGDRLDHQPGNG